MLALTSLALAGCGGGGTESQTNSAPTFTSAASASVVENTAGTAYSVKATDAQGDSITYSISGGADASAFTLSGNALAFATPPNYDLPGDANGDNVYEVVLTASDGKLSSTLTLNLTVTNDREGISVKRIATGLDNPVGITSLGSGSNLVVAESDGTLLKIVGSTGAQSQYYRFVDSVGNPISLTVLGITRAAAYSNTEGTYVLEDESGIAYLVCVDCPIKGKQAVGSIDDTTPMAIGTGPDGSAYIGVGDTAGTRAQDTGSVAGSLFRVDAVADPYAGASVTYYTLRQLAIGLRAPAGITAFPDGNLAISDRGASVLDELSLTSALSNALYYADSGVNFGWPYFEGTEEVNAGGAALANKITPSLTVPLGSELRQSRGIVGGVAYTGAIAGIKNHYVFADADGRIWSIPLANLSASTTLDASALEVRDEDFKPDVGTIDHPVGMALDANGTLYILDSDGELYRVDAS